MKTSAKLREVARAAFRERVGRRVLLRGGTSALPRDPARILRTLEEVARTLGLSEGPRPYVPRGGRLLVRSEGIAKRLANLLRWYDGTVFYSLD